MSTDTDIRIDVDLDTANEDDERHAFHLGCQPHLENGGGPGVTRCGLERVSIGGFRWLRGEMPADICATCRAGNCAACGEA